MSVQRLKRGVYLVRWFDETGRQRGRRFSSKTEADAFEGRQKMMKAGRRSGGLVASRMRLGDYLEVWRDRHGVALATSTLRQRRGVLNAHVVPRLGEARLCDLTAVVVRDWRGELRRDGVSVGQCNAALRDLSAVLGAAVSDQLLLANPCLGIRRLPAESVKARRVLAPLEIEQLRVLVPTLRDVILVELVGYAGLRPGEALALRWGAVGDGKVRIEDNFTDGEFKPPKTGQRRVVDVVAPLAEDLALYRPAGSAPDDLVLEGKGGGPLPLGSWRRWVWQPALQAAGIRGGVRIYDLRHSAASALIAEGRPVNYVQTQLGHSSPILTLETYSHVFEDYRWPQGTTLVSAIRQGRRKLPERLLRDVDPDRIQAAAQREREEAERLGDEIDRFARPV